MPSPDAGNRKEFRDHNKCCYDKEGNLINDGSESQGSIDLVKTTSGDGIGAEDARGNCNFGIGVVGHYLMDVAWVENPNGRMRDRYVQDCLRSRGVPSGSAGGGLVSDSELRRAWHECWSVASNRLAAVERFRNDYLHYYDDYRLRLRIGGETTVRRPVPAAYGLTGEDILAILIYAHNRRWGG